MFLLSALLVVLAPAPLTLPELLDEVGDRAPLVEAAEADTDVAEAAIGVAGAWDDPTLSVMSDSIPVFGGADADPTMITYRLGQPLELFGRRGLAKRSATARVDRAQARVRRVSWDARAQAVSLFYELWMNGAMATLIDDQLALLGQMRDAALARVTVGAEMAHHDVLRAESEIASMEAEKASLADEHDALVTMLNTLRGHEPTEAVGEVELPALEALPDADTAAALAVGAPEVEAARAMRDEADAQVGLARKMYWPMVMIEGEYEQKLGMPDGIGIGISVTIPLWWHDRQDHELAMAKSMVRAAEREESAMQKMAAADARMAWSEARASTRKLDALVIAIAKMREVIDSAQALYVTGNGDLLPYLESVMKLQELRTRQIQATADAGVARFEVSRVVGAEVTP
jgi:outer membrane protein TolC